MGKRELCFRWIDVEVVVETELCRMKYHVHVQLMFSFHIFVHVLFLVYFLYEFVFATWLATDHGYVFLITPDGGFIQIWEEYNNIEQQALDFSTLLYPLQNKLSCSGLFLCVFISPVCCIMYLHSQYYIILYCVAFLCLVPRI